MNNVKYSTYNNFFVFKVSFGLSPYSCLTLSSLNLNFISLNVFESVRSFISSNVKKKLNYQIFNNTLRIPLYNKPNNTRMGKGNGKFYLWLWNVVNNQSLLELTYLSNTYLFFYLLSNLNYNIPFSLYINP